jgi:hypothetical protein
MISLKSEELVVKSVLKRTRAGIFGDIDIGDKIQLSMTIEDTTGASHGGIYATYITAKNLQTGEESLHSQTRIHKFVQCFEWE